ncbi:MAG: Fe-S-containing hydro-lyase [bacterium]|nr:Fe-S-containing hydro-lyase [bacterium]
MIKKIQTPLTLDVLETLNAGDFVEISGVVYGARDAAHRRFKELIEAGKELPFDVKGAVIYYVGPTPAKPGYVIGSAGPTTASRMDSITPLLLKLGLKGTIGKGNRSEEVIEAMKNYKAVYFAAIGGSGALLSKRIKSSRIIAFEELGTEAVYEFYFDNFPAIVINDIHGRDFYKLKATSL